MDTRLDLNFLNNSPLLKRSSGQQPQQSGVANVQNNKSTKLVENTDVVSLPQQGRETSQNQAGQQAPVLKSTRLISEDITNLENGYRRTQNFEQADGRNFTRIEEFTSNTDRARRISIQQNNSGSTSRSEEVLDRQSDGSFRLTQLFVNEIGEEKTNITFDVVPENTDVIFGRTPSPESNAYLSTYQRGTSYDVTI